MSTLRRAQLWTVGLLLLAVVLIAAEWAGALDWLGDPINIDEMR